MESYDCIPRDGNGARKESCKGFSSPRVVRKDAPDEELEKAAVNSVENVPKYKPEIKMFEVIEYSDDDSEDKIETQEPKRFNCKDQKILF